MATPAATRLRTTVVFTIHPMTEKIPVQVLPMARDEVVKRLDEKRPLEAPLPPANIPTELVAILKEPNPHGLLALVVQRVVLAGWDILFLSQFSNSSKFH
jgi:hypothetical protein